MDSSVNGGLTLARRDFVQLSAGIIGGLGIPGLFDGVVEAADDNETTTKSSLDESYLELGLIGMARSNGWFNAHLGAAVLAGYYMCNENRFSDAIVDSVKKQLDALIATHREQFSPFENVSGAIPFIEDVPRSLNAAVQGGLRAHGHAVIYTALSVRALRDVPHMADPRLIKLLCGHNGQIAQKTPSQPRVFSEYADTQAMIEALFDSLARFEPLVGRPTVRRPNFTHMTTHTEALMSLDAMGYTELAKAGQRGHQAHIDEPVPDFNPAEHPLDERESTLADIMNEDFWQDEDNQKQWNGPWNVKKNPNGYWLAFGHLFKVLYSYHRLIGRIQDKDKVALCSRVLLERCVNPEVQGG
ncbi:hypothetical protein [Novipirellula sp.]|uniref:hypothetical protein n=1 Tax=Novipirellula sp. TaxID=2795430 RepID=UPI003566247D